MTPHPQPAIAVGPSPRVKRSVYGNYLDAPDRLAPEATASGPSMPGIASPTGGCAELALARSFLHQLLARAFDYPTDGTWRWLCHPDTQAACQAACHALDPGTPSTLAAHGQALADALRTSDLDAFHNDYIVAIGHAARGSCPINEIEYGDLKADPLFQPHRLADLGAFYHAFGLELRPSAGERQDQLSIALEFMSVLSAQEAHALNTQPDGEARAICHHAQRKFLREHLGRWTPAFTRRLQRAVSAGALTALARFALAFIENECHRAGVPSGNEDLFLRPADQGAALCGGCGLEASLPGAAGDLCTPP
jgi:putative dimethyl sulfoxide reductase chaperone